MNRKRTNRLEQVLRYEQRLMDDLRQNMGQEISKLNQIQSQIDANRKKRQSVFTQDTTHPFAIHTAQSRTQYADRLEQFEQQLEAAKEVQQHEVDSARAAVLEQRKRVQAIETLVKKLQNEAHQSQLAFENHELYDTVVNKSLEPKP